MWYLGFMKIYVRVRNSCSSRRHGKVGWASLESRTNKAVKWLLKRPSVTHVPCATQNCPTSDAAMKARVKDCDLIGHAVPADVLRGGCSAVGWAPIQFHWCHIHVVIDTLSCLTHVHVENNFSWMVQGRLYLFSQIKDFWQYWKWKILANWRPPTGHSSFVSWELTCCPERFSPIPVFWIPPWPLSPRWPAQPPAELAPRACSAVPTLQPCHGRDPGKTGGGHCFVMEGSFTVLLVTKATEYLYSMASLSELLFLRDSLVFSELENTRYKNIASSRNVHTSTRNYI